MPYVIPMSRHDLGAAYREAIGTRTDAQIVVISESHSGEMHERAFQRYVIDGLAAGIPVVFEAGSRRGSLDEVAAYAHARGNLPVTMADAPDAEFDALLAEHRYADAMIGARSRSFFETALQQLPQSPAGVVFLFVGAGHLKGIEEAAKACGQNISLRMVNLADVNEINMGSISKWLLGASLFMKGCPLSKIGGEVEKFASASRYVQEGDVVHLEKDRAWRDEILAAVWPPLGIYG